MYSDCSQRYWKQKKKPNLFKRKVTIVSIGIFTIVLLVGKVHRKRKYQERLRVLLEERKMVRPSPTEGQFQICESNMRDSVDTECSKLCINELLSIPRPTMHKSCMHGCSRSFFSAAVIGCRMGSMEEAFQEDHHIQANNSCSRFRNVDPQPYVLSTCGKHYREGTKRGRNLGHEFINNLIDTEWTRIKNEG